MTYQDPMTKSNRSPLEWIACDIVERAVLDWRLYGHMLKLPHKASGVVADTFNFARKAGFATPRDSLIWYFHSELFIEHCTIVGESIDPDEIVKFLGIPDTKPLRVEKQMSIFEYSSVSSWE